jgi:ATP-binding cassette subfamily B multidrug efflux pump
VLSLVGILITMFVLNAWLALATDSWLCPSCSPSPTSSPSYTRTGFRELQQRLGELNAVMEESISGQKVVKAFPTCRACR